MATIVHAGIFRPSRDWRPGCRGSWNTPRRRSPSSDSSKDLHRKPGIGCRPRRYAVITGAQDVLIPARNSELIAERIRGAKLHLIPNAGHGFFTEGREEFERVFVPFVKAHPLGA